MAGLYISGGGMTGVLQAIKAAGRGTDIITVGHDVTEHTKLGLIDNVLSMVFAHPIQGLAQETISQMQRDLLGASPQERECSTSRSSGQKTSRQEGSFEPMRLWACIPRGRNYMETDAVAASLRLAIRRFSVATRLISRNAAAASGILLDISV